MVELLRSTALLRPLPPQPQQPWRVVVASICDVLWFVAALDAEQQPQPQSQLLHCTNSSSSSSNGSGDGGMIGRCQRRLAAEAAPFLLRLCTTLVNAEGTTTTATTTTAAEEEDDAVAGAAAPLTLGNAQLLTKSVGVLWQLTFSDATIVIYI